MVDLRDIGMDTVDGDDIPTLLLDSHLYDSTTLGNIFMGGSLLIDFGEFSMGICSYLCAQNCRTVSEAFFILLFCMYCVWCWCLCSVHRSLCKELEFVGWWQFMRGDMMILKSRKQDTTDISAAQVQGFMIFDSTKGDLCTA